MQPGQRKLSSYAFTLMLAIVGIAIVPAPASATGPTMEFGINIGAIDEQTNAGIKPNYAVLWAGPWTIDNWAYFDGQLASVASRGVTPVIQFYYWGNDLNTHCWNNGCYSKVHGYWKDQSGWQKLAAQLTQHLELKLAGKKAILVIETEFNKGDMGYSETLDAGLAAKAWYLRNNYPPAVVALGFGNWGHSNWGVFDRAAAASHEMGLQGMRASTRDSVTSYTGLPGALLKGAQELKNRFGKPIIIHDIAASSYPEPDWLKHQATVIRSLFTRIGEFENVGVHALIYRGLKDNPSATTAEYYGEAERHFGLRWHANNTAKPAYAAWRDGILDERAPREGTPSSFAPTFQIKAPNEWWQEVYIQDTNEWIAGVDVRDDGGAWKAMKKSSWGAWTSSYNTKAGSKIEFLARSNSGVAQSMPFYWMNGETRKPTVGSSPSPTPSGNPISVPGEGSAFREIEVFSTRTNGASYANGAASGGRIWGLWGNGHVAETVDFTSGGTYQIRVRAQGQLAQGVRPHMDVYIGDLKVLGADPSSGYLADYVGEITVGGPVTKTVKIAFTNDMRTSSEDRNLLLDRLEIRRI